MWGGGVIARALACEAEAALLVELCRSDRIDELVEQRDVPLLGGDELVLNQFAARRVDVVEAFFVVLQAVLFAFLERLEARGVAEEVRGALRELRPRAPGAGRVARL